MLRNNDPSKPRVHGNEHINGQEDPIPGALIFIGSQESDSAEQVSSVAENTLATLSLPANSYDKILIEAEIRERYEVDASNKTNNTFKIKETGVTKKTFSSRIIALATASADSGNRHTFRISTIIAGGQTSTASITLTGQMSINNANCGLLIYSFRLWGINKKIRP